MMMDRVRDFIKSAEFWCLIGVIIGSVAMHVFQCWQLDRTERLGAVIINDTVYELKERL